jgi:prepilin-type N-terminal cleavage/methylation domain-containing protein
MLKNNKGFSIVELLAVIVITSLILVPLLRSFSKNLQINDLEHRRRSAVNIAEGTLYGFNKIDYLDLYTLLAVEDGNGDYYLEIDQNSCALLGTAEDRGFCVSIFTTIHNNLELPAEIFKVYIYDYNMDAIQLGIMLRDDRIPKRVRDDMEASNIGDGSLVSLMRITVWINQSTSPDQYVVISGLIYDE